MKSLPFVTLGIAILVFGIGWFTAPMTSSSMLERRANALQKGAALTPAEAKQLKERVDDLLAASAERKKDEAISEAALMIGITLFGVAGILGVLRRRWERLRSVEPRRVVPIPIKLLCGILIVVPLMEGVTRLVQAQGDIPWRYQLPSVWEWLAGFALHTCVAAALAQGVNWIRWTYVVVVGLLLVGETTPRAFFIIVGFPPPLPIFVGLAEWVAYATTVVLCLVASNAHFEPKPTPTELPEPTPGPAPGRD